ncbi:hypothetical protein [Hymenobacter negativus]|uniref:DUF4843 domain-containing protein n=1 Tax=Hymenobacter negativus TaxID=2795026 RepID=A0ABS3QLA4_9BACT|nr:hypothetical protein [Hymenobacter negativus]MBO2011544.1 hypothetical protein [Hymenobacter negativus]
MKNYFASLLLLLSAATTLSSCRETSRLPEPAYESIPIIFPEINPQKSYFDLVTSRYSINALATANATRPVFEFVVNPSQGYSEIQTVEVYKSFFRTASSTLGPRVKVIDLTSFPATVSINSQQALEGLFPTTPTTDIPNPIAVLGASPTLQNRIINGNAVVFTFEYVMKDGRRITLTPLSTTVGSIGAPTGPQSLAPMAAYAYFATRP